MTDHELLLLRTEALNRTSSRLARIREMAVDAQSRRGLLLAEDVLLLTDYRPKV